MAVTFDAVGPAGGGGATNSTGAALTWSHTCGASATYLLAGATLDANPDTGFSMTATYNGVSMTSLGVVHSGAAAEGFIQLWGMASPPTGSAHNVVVTPAGGTASGINGGSLSFNGAGALSAVQTATGTVSTATLGFTGSSSGNLVAMFCGATNPLTSTAGTSRFLFTGDNVHFCGNEAASTIAGGGTVTCTWTEASSPFDWAVIAVEVQASGNVTGVAAHVTVAGGTGTPAGGGIQVVNQWAATFAQPSAFGSMPPALQSTVIALNGSTSVGGGSGVPSAGNWLFCIAGLNEQTTGSGFTVGDADDIHSFWRPGIVSTSAALTRASIWYTANLARTANDVYVAPNGAFDATSVLVVEVAGLGPWDVVTGAYGNYAAAATSLNLALSAPSASSFTIAAVCGDNDSVSQAFAPAGWTALATVTATNGTDHTCDSVLTSAVLPSNSGALSVNGAAGSASDLSGVILSVQLGAPSPIPGGANPAWAGRMILEAGFGSGFETPADQVTWTTLSDSGAAPGSTKRFWGWSDDSGVPYTLGQLQSSRGTVQLDNADGALSPSNNTASGIYYPNVTTGTPIRLRVALGSYTGPLGTTVINRWYVFSRNALEWPEKRNEGWRTFVELATTDIWSVASASCPSPYRGEVRQDSPYAWWPLDDLPGSGGVFPTALRNAAAGNSNTLNVVVSPNGALSQYFYSVNGTSSSALLAPSVATYTAGASAGWMFGDPQSSPASYATSNPVTASPGSAAWQATGQAGTTGSYGWFLSCNDAGFPVLANGITVEGWFSYPPEGSTNGWFPNPPATGYFSLCQQPETSLTLLELATGSNPVAVLQMDGNGHLNLITYNGATGTSHSVYSSTDLRCGNWFSVSVALTTTTWTVYVNGGATAAVSGSATGMTSAWTWLIVNGDLGTHGGSSAGTGLVHGGNVSVSHLAVYPLILPAWRVRDHYWAAVTGFGLIPAPTGVATQWGPSTASSNGLTSTNIGVGWAPDGTAGTATYNICGSGVTASAVVTANVAGFTSGPSARAIGNAWVFSPNPTDDWLWVTWTGVAPSFSVYTSANAGDETLASVVFENGESFTSGYGGSASGAGVGHISGATGASPPAAPSSIGDTVAQRIERCLAYGLVTQPGRAIDVTPQKVQAALDVGGQQCGANINSQVQSDNGMLFVDNAGVLNYRAKAHLAADTTVWNLSSAGPAYGYPFQPGQVFQNDVQHLVNVIAVTPYAPDGASLPVITPANATAANTSQQQYGPRPMPVSSYLQSSSAQLSQANWLLSNFSTLQRRVDTLTVDAAGYPPAWLYVMGVNAGDIVQVTDQPMLGGPMTVGTYRVTSVSRKIAFGANGLKPEASATITADPIPASYWS